MAMSSWMESVTGRSNSEHQAWRDNFNGGWAAGDITGLTNQQIASDRADAGERNPEVLANLPAGYRLNPNPTGPLSGRGGSGGQGASPSQSGGNNPVVLGNPAVRRSGSTLGVGQITGSRVNFGQGGSPSEFGSSVARAWGAFATPGVNKHPMDEPEKHGQLIINGHKVTHDTGWSPAMVIEDIYGEVIAAVYGAVKAGADWNATVGLDRALDARQAPFYKTGQDITAWMKGTYAAADTAWDQMVRDANKSIPAGYESKPGPANPYAGASPWSMPFN